MTKITVRITGGAVAGIEASGHTGYAEAGSDIVCAAVSAVIQTAGAGVKKYCDRAEARITGESGYLIRVPASCVNKPEVAAVLSTAVLGIRDIAEQYPKHIKLEEIIK